MVNAADIVEALQTSATYADIAKQFGITRQRVAQIAKENNLARYINFRNVLIAESNKKETK